MPYQVKVIESKKKPEDLEKKVAVFLEDVKPEEIVSVSYTAGRWANQMHRSALIVLDAWPRE